MPSTPPPPDRYDEAIRFFRRKVPLTDPEFRDLDEAERQRAFWVAGVTQAQPLQEVFDAIDRAIRDGTTLEDFKAEVGAQLEEAWGGPDSNRIETVFRTNVMTAYNAARHEIFQEPAVKEERPYLQFHAVGDSRTSDICEALDGVVLPADDGFWHSHTPPLHFNCRSVLVSLTKEEGHDEGVTSGRPDTGDARPDEGFGRPPAPGDGEPNLDQFDPDLRSAVSRRLK